MIKKFLQEQSGRTMLEAIGYISVMIAITIALTAAVNSGYDRFRTGRINQQLVDLKKVISQRYVAVEKYDLGIPQTLIKEKIAPHDMIKGSILKHAFGGAVNVYPVASQTMFKINFTKLPKKACIELGSKLWVVNDGSDLYAMKINNTVWGWKYSNMSLLSLTKHKELPANVADVSKACNLESNSIHWIFN